MTRMGRVFLSLLVVGLLVQAGVASRRSNNNNNNRNNNENNNELRRQPTPFRAGNQYVFEYNGQIATGLMGPQDDQNEQAVGSDLENSFDDENPQKAVTRLQAKVKINFIAENRAQLQLEQTRVGQLNGKSAADPKRVQPMAMFEEKSMDTKKQRELHLPIEFVYADGVVEHVSFHRDDRPWSRNVKRAVLNLIQLNLKRKNIDAQQQHQQQKSSVKRWGGSSEEDFNGNNNNNNNDNNNNNNNKWGKAFVIPETSIEGTCMTTYTINDNSKFNNKNIKPNGGDSSKKMLESSEEFDGESSQYNVTKSIDFKNCQQIADVGYGFHSQDEQSAKCARANNNNANNNYYNSGNNNNKNRQTQYPTSPADESCDPKEVNEEKLERSTVHRVECVGEAQSKVCAIKRAEVRSHYVFKSFASQTDARTASAMHTIAVAQLIFRGSQPSPSGKMLQERDIQTNNNNNNGKANANANSLLYDNEWAVSEKRFYMLGDEAINGQDSPFKLIENKVEQAQMIFQRLIQSTVNKAHGIEGTTAVELQQLVELLRMSTAQELKSIHKTIASAHTSHHQQQQQNRGEAEKIEQLFANTLAIAGTRNTIQLLIQKIQSGELSTAKAAKCLKNLNRIPAPSDQIASMISGLCKSELAHRSPALAQSCWLTYGAMVGDMCRDKISAKAQQDEQQNWPQQQQQQQKQIASGQQQQQQMLFGTQSGFDKTQVCSSQKKNEYKQILLGQYKQASNTYEKVLALKAIGNAGLDNAVSEIEKIATSSSESPAVRAAAIDAMRRLRTQMPRKIQRVTLPIFQNTKERAEVRMAAFQILMSTQPEKPVFDQILYTLTKERSREVKSFVYTAMKSLADSQIASEQNIAKHVKSALRLSGIDEEEAQRASAKMQWPVHSADGRDGAVLKWLAVFGERQMLPSHWAAGIDTIFNGNKNSDSVKLSLTQQGTNRWLENVVEALFGREAAREMRESNSQTRARRNEATNSRRADQQLRDVYAKLGVKRRQQHANLQSYRAENANAQREQPSGGAYAMLNLRVGDVDHAVLPLDEQTLPQPLRRVLEAGESSSSSQGEILRLLAGFLEKQHYRSLSAMNFNEKTARIPTSAGVPLRIQHSTPVLACIEASAKVPSQEPKMEVNAHAIITGVHVQSMEAWTPFGSSGVESARTLEINAPLQMEIAADKSQQNNNNNNNNKHTNNNNKNNKSVVMSGVKFTWIVPKDVKTRLFGFHTLAFTYTRDFAGKNNMQRSAAKLRTIQNPTLDAILAPLSQLNKVVGQRSLSMPIRISGQLHSPNRPTDWAQWLQIVMSTENHVHVTLEPTAGTPSKIAFRVTSALFQRAAGAHLTDALQPLKNFYEGAEQSFAAAYPQDFEDMEMDTFHQRIQKLDKAMTKKTAKYAQSQIDKDNKGESAVYKHSIKLDVHAVGAQNNAKAQLKFDAVCDARFSACAMFSELERSAIYAEEDASSAQAWTWKANAQILTPESVSSPAELERLGAGKQQKLIARAEAQWGTDRQQFVTVRVQGENVQRKQQSGQQQSEWNNNNNNENKISAWQSKRASAFINKFDAVLDYKLQPYAQNFVSRAFDVLKTRNFWATQSRLEQSGRDGQTCATLMIEPQSGQQATLQVRTPTQAVRIGGLQLPYSVRPMPLIQSGEKSTHSIAQALTRFARQSTRAECTVDGRYVETFDGASFKGPITNTCYSVLAKDCANEAQPQFAVLMKSLSQDGKQKKIKVITPDHMIECWSENNESYDRSKKIACEINGKKVEQQSSRVPSWGASSSSSEEEPHKHGQTSPIVEYNNEERTSVTITAPSGAVAVRFGCQCADCQCQKALIQLSNKHKYAQCGLCGHFDDSAADEWRKGDNKHADNLADFHRSYSVMGDDAEECTKESQDKFYADKKNKFEVLNKNTNYEWIDENSADDEGMASDNSSQQDDQDQDQSEDEDEWTQRDNSYFGGYAQDSQSDEDEGFYGASGRSANNNNNRIIEPKLKTKVIEHNHQVCFSTHPVKQCPSGSRAVSADDDDDSSSSAPKKTASSKTSATKTLKFVCMPRAEAAPYMRDIRRVGQAKLEDRAPNFVDSVPEPSKCKRF